MHIYCYRDLLDGERYEYFGCTLYFIADDAASPSLKAYDSAVSFSKFLHGSASPSSVEKSVRKWIDTQHPIVQFVRNCIDSGTIQNICLKLLTGAGIKSRRQNAQALYKFLALEKSMMESPISVTEQPDFEMFEEVQDHFANQLEIYFGSMVYEPAALSQCSANEIDILDPSGLAPGDFVFEIGRRQTGKFEYYGWYHHALDAFKPLKMFPEFDLRALKMMLK